MEKRLIYKSIFILAILGLCVYFTFPLNKRINLGLDLKGGMHLLLKVDTAKVPENAREDAADRAIEVIRKRIDSYGVREPLIQKHGVDEIVVELPGFTDRERARELIGKVALLEFKLVSADQAALADALAGKVPENYELKYTQDDNAPLLVEKNASLIGEALTDAN
ncbi:MAG: hypothetical protein PHO03_04370, partial [Candidatus Omnitrophica bacterium]|nr:hypothetical protein [Candidatus Omnitrophota bacterium]